jgi:hypothetical protein
MPTIKTRRWRRRAAAALLITATILNAPLRSAMAQQRFETLRPRLTEVFSWSIDVGRNAAAASARVRGIQPAGVDDLASNAQEELRAVFPEALLDEVRFYFAAPLNDTSLGIGFLNAIAVLWQGGALVLGLTFEHEVYLVNSAAALATSPLWRAVAAHELVHAAQYRAFGYETYKEMYGSDLASGVPVCEVRLEKEAYLFMGHFPCPGNRAFFAFYREPGIREKALAGGRLVALDSLRNVHTCEVEITAQGEVFPRKASLLLRTETDGVPVQLLDPHGGRPLLVLDLAAEEETELLFNGRAAPGGSCLVLTANSEATRAVWRDQNGFSVHSLSGRATVSVESGTATIVDGLGKVWRGPDEAEEDSGQE